MISYQVLTHTRRGPRTLDRSPEFLFKTSNLYVSIKSDEAGEPLVGPLLSPELYSVQI